MWLERLKDGEEIFTKTDESVTESSTFSSKKKRGI